jgi:hypothetical protein
VRRKRDTGERSREPSAFLPDEAGVMRCRHTVPDWHRFVTADREGMAILAGCRLLVKEGEQAGDPRTIACAYWGRQRECPLYDGPEGRAQGPAPDHSGIPRQTDDPVAVSSVWPVRPPGSVDSQRVVLMVLALLAIALLGWAVTLGTPALAESRIPVVAVIIGGAAIVISVATHVLTLLRLWVGR